MDDQAENIYYKKSLAGFAAVLVIMLFSHAAMANNIAASNAVLGNTDPGAGTAEVKFDLSWENSWHADWIESGVTPSIAVANWDAAWVFVKYRVANGDWHHATLDSAQPAAPADTTIDMGSTDGVNVGAFVYRSESGWSGNQDLTDVKLRWNYAANGLNGIDDVDVEVHAIEMVYVADGSYDLGSGGTESGHFFEHDGTGSPDLTDVYTVSSESEITVGINAGNLWGIETNIGDEASIGGPGIISSSFPNGYSAFYCMKYEMSQEKYADFLNRLSKSDAAERYPDRHGEYRHVITRVAGVYGCDGNANGVLNEDDDAIDRACNYLTWADGSAYADWAGLRPMTELEFEKACRGSLPGVANEYAWGNTALSRTTTITNDGTGMSMADGNCNSSTPDGPYRCGIYATANSTREQAGSTYWGIMEMSGNLFERTVTIGNAEGRAFTGSHGDGELSSGNATNPDWPGADAVGSGMRGGNWNLGAATRLRVSMRLSAADGHSSRNRGCGWRGVRSAP